MKQAAAPELAWYCVRPDGTRHGPFQTAFPDDTIETAGAYRDGQLDGPWTRRAPGGPIVEEGAYDAGVKDGTWTQRTAIGNVLGTYEGKRDRTLDKNGNVFGYGNLLPSLLSKR